MLPESCDKNDGVQPDDPHSVIALKRHCINLLLKIVKTLPTITKQYTDEILRSVISVAPHVSMMQKASLVQVLAALSNSASSGDNQRALLDGALRDGLAFIEGAEFEL